MAKSNFFLELLAGTLAEVGELTLVELLQELHDKDPDGYKSAIYGGISFVTGISKLTTRTKTKIDDAFVNAIKDAVETSAAANGLELPE